MTHLPDSPTETPLIDLSDIPELDEAWFQGATLRRPGDRPQRPIRIDADLVEFFRSRTKDDQAAINAILRSFVERAREKAD